MAIKHFRIKIYGEEVEFDINKDLSINEDDLNRELSEQPGKYAFWSTSSSLAEIELQKIEFELSQLEAIIDAKIRKEAREEGERITETIVANRIKMDSDYEKMFEKVLDKRANRSLLRSVKDAFSQRKDSLISIASNLRVERDAVLQFKKSAQRGQ